MTLQVMTTDLKSFTSVFLLLILTLQTSFGQTESPEYSLRVGVFTETITHPGINLGWSSLLMAKQKTVEKKNGSIDRKSELHLVSQLGVYQHIANHTGLLYSASLGHKRYVTSRRLTHFYGLGFGGLTQVNSGATYEMISGEIEESNLKSRTYFHSFLFYEIGYQISQKLNGYTRVQLGGKFPYNTFFSVVPILESGITIPLKLKSDKE